MLKFSSLSIVLATLSFAAVGCQRPAGQCDTASCAPEGDGDGEEPTGGSSGDGDGDGDIGGEGGGMATACDACRDKCLNDVCVGCVEDGQCADQEVCDDEGNCVGCVDNDDCTDATLPLCNSTTNECEACDGDDSCGDLGNRCLGTGACVECTPETDDRTSDTDDCGTGVCNPQTYECESSLLQGDKDVCESCIADAECAADHNCVPMDFKGEAREGGWCLKDSTVDGCNDNPYRSPTPMRVSISGAPATVYCGINEVLTTCEAIWDLENDQSCADSSECGAPGLDDGLCETVSLTASKCTYECDGPAQCRASDPGSGCAGDAAGDAGNYCGG